MSEITLNVNGQRVKVDQSFLQLSPEQQEATVEEIANSIGARTNRGPMAQVNKGIAESVGGFVDFVNPFDRPHSLNPFSDGTGSAVAGIENVMNAGGIRTAQGEPETGAEAFFRGSGQAAGALPMVGGGLNILRQGSGMVANVADDVFRPLATTGGSTAEVVAGGISEGARQATENMGGGEFAQNIAAIAAPVGAFGGLATAGALVKRAPGVTLGRQAIRSASAAVAPFTEAGGREVARRRMRELAGGGDRAFELAEMTEGENPLNLTPAQQTQDPNLLGLERLAADQDPLLRVELERRAAQSRDLATEAVRQGAGDVQDARDVFAQQRQQFSDELNRLVQDRVSRAGATLDAQSPQFESVQNSEKVKRAIDGALDQALSLEADLWARVPTDAVVTTQTARQTAQDLIARTPRAQQNDVPQIARELLGENGFGDQETVAEMHGLYSELRRVARSAMAGNDQNKNKARIANSIADAILQDLGTRDPSDEVGQLINSARTYSAELHETFDRGAVGKILKRTLDGDTTVDSQLSLQSTVGRGGDVGAVAASQITQAAPQSERFVTDYIKGMFADVARNESGQFDRRAAARFVRNNRELLARFPDLRNDIAEAVDAGDSAEAFADRVASRLSRLQNKSASTVARFLDGPPERAVKAVTQSQNPAQAAARLANAARKDPSGEAMAGLKDAFSSELIGSQLSSQSLSRRLEDKRFRAALNRIYTPAEMSRLSLVAKELAKIDSATARDVGDSLSGAKAGKIISTLVRIKGASVGANAAGGGLGGGLQGAQIVSSNANELVNRLTADKASQIIADAITDPALFRALLTDAGSKKYTKRVEATILPYLIGAGAGSVTEEQP